MIRMSTAIVTDAVRANPRRVSTWRSVARDSHDRFLRSSPESLLFVIRGRRNPEDRGFHRSPPARKHGRRSEALASRNEADGLNDPDRIARFAEVDELLHLALRLSVRVEVRRP